MARRERDQEVFRIELAARAKAAADVVLDHVDASSGRSDLLGEDAAVEERHLGRARDREPALGGVPFGHDAARLHGQAVVAAGAEGLAPHIGRLGEGRVGVAACTALKSSERLLPGGFEQQALVAAARRASRPPPAAARSRPRSPPARPRRWRRCRPAPPPSARRHSAPSRAAMTGCSNGLNSGNGCSRIGTIGGPPGISFAVMTACTPGIFSAALVSMDTMRPCATELRRMTA